MCTRETIFTVITSTYNAASTLPRLLESLATQTFRNFELVIQDGESSDDTACVVEEWRDKLPFVSFASVSDTGIYDAWNKALERVRGQWVLFLGADDMLAGPDVFEKVFQCLPSDPHIVFLAGDISIRNAEHVETLYASPVFTHAKENLFYRMPLLNPSSFYKRTLFDTLNFDSSYKIAGDYDFMCKVWTDNDIAIKLNILVANMYLGGVSSNKKYKMLRLKECYRIGRLYSGFWTWVYNMYISYLRDNVARFCKKYRLLNAFWCVGRTIYRKIWPKT